MQRIYNLGTLVLCAGLLFNIQLLQAQLFVGGRIGPNLATLHGSSVKNNSMIIGYNVGGFVNFAFTEQTNKKIGQIFTIQAELSAETKGTKSDYMLIDPNNGNQTVNVTEQRFTYVSVPVLAKFSFGDPKKLRLFAEAGFFGASLFGLKIDGKSRRDNDGIQTTDERKYSEEYAGFDFGLLVGTGVSVPVGGRKSPYCVYGNIRYSAGLNNIGSYRGTIDIPEDNLKDVKTGTVNLLFGFTYKIPEKPK